MQVLSRNSHLPFPCSEGIKRRVRHGVVTVSKDDSGTITISFPYDPQLVEKVKKENKREIKDF